MQAIYRDCWEIYLAKLPLTPDSMHIPHDYRSGLSCSSRSHKSHPRTGSEFPKNHAVAGLVLRLLLAGNPKIHRIGPQRYCHGSSGQTSSTLLSETPTSEYRDDDIDKKRLNVISLLPGNGSKSDMALVEPISLLGLLELTSEIPHFDQQTWPPA